MRMGSITIFTLLFITSDAFSVPPKRLGNVADRTRSRGARRGPAPTMAFSTVTEKPARAALAAAYVGFAGAIATFPGEFSNPADIELITNAINDPTSMNPVFFFVFNSLGLLPAVFAALMLPGAGGQRLAPFSLGSAFFAGFGGLGPYMILRDPRPDPVKRSELGFVPRYVTESRLFGIGLLFGALYLYSVLVGGFSDASVAAYGDLFASSKLVSVSTVDFCILSTFAFEPIKEDMARRGWWDEDAPEYARLLAFCVPVVGPAAYVALRPALEE
mmetsp:Transcript_29057/g.86790  ORF Transcript_29057/g.86790 Transcript_29057/m.86790 type:complete len:274 (+) Transcript_29057:170-991(+)